MLDNQTRRELLSKARQSGFPGSILDVFTAYEQGKDLIGEFQQQQQQQQSQQMSDMAAQQAGMMAPGQQPLPQEIPQAPVPPPPGLQGQQLPSPPPPSNPNLVDSSQQQDVGMATNAKGSAGGQVLMANGGFVEKFTEDQYNKFSSHFPFSKEQRESIAHRATVENPDLTMVNPKKYVFGGLKYAVGGFEGDPLKKGNIATAADSSYVANSANSVHNFYIKNGYKTMSPAEISRLYGGDPPHTNMTDIFEDLKIARDLYKRYPDGRNVDGTGAVSYNEYTNYKPENHRFEQRELTTGQLNTKAPRSKYDDRILPQKYTVYSGSGDVAEVANYDKLAVTPWSQLTETQKIKRLQQYGGSGTPYKDKASITNAIKELKNPVPERLDMKEATRFPMPQVDIKPQITSLPIPQTTKQRVTINTGQGDKVRVQDIKTKRFLGWEDPSGETLDFEEYKPTGNATEDFPEMRRIKTPSFEKGGFNYTKNMLNANSTTGPRSEQSWQDPGVNRFSGNTNGVNADYYFEKGGLKNKVVKKFRAAGFETDPPKKEPAKEEDVQMREDYAVAMAALEAQRESYAKRLADEQARVKKVRANVVPTARKLDYDDSHLSEEAMNAFYRSTDAKNPTELAAAKKAYPQELRNVLPAGGNYNIADWDEAAGDWKQGKGPDRELYCTPYGCFTYQKAGAKDVPNIPGNFGFTGGVEDGTLPFKKVSDKEAEPGDMAIVYGSAPMNYTDRSAGYGIRPHHTTVLSDKNPIVRDEKGNVEGINMFNASGGMRLGYEEQFYPVEDHFGFYRYVGQTPKLEKEGKGFPIREKEIEDAYNARHAAWLAQQPIPEMMAMKEPRKLRTQGMPMVTSQLQKSSFPSFEQPNKKVKRTKIKI